MQCKKNILIENHYWSPLFDSSLQNSRSSIRPLKNKRPQVEKKRQQLKNSQISKVESNKKKASLVAGLGGINRQQRPRICLRLVVNCRTNPEHR